MTDNVYMTMKKLSKVRRLDLDCIFSKVGKPFRTDFINKSYRKADIDNFRFHDLCHDFCSELIQIGVELYTVAAVLDIKALP